MTIQKIHHVAYRCKDAGETAEFYKMHLGMRLIGAFAEDHVPSTKAPDPYMHIFLDAGGGNVLAFFELPNAPEMDRDRNTPDWVQHLAFELESIDELISTKKRLEEAGLDVVGPTNHALFHSIYFRDPNGHRIELAVNTATAEQLNRMQDVADLMLRDWNLTKTPPRYMAWTHEIEFGSR
ncbi:VOC family protein [Acidocella aminolytica]|uniref:Glyoxalase/bleomycin resistance protein/dioxygenase n=1 Tax=Acidocella aminolytica 101 = DSM 11237 TaxID=1120923 RepID=A0A0D6PGX9_9PROT|nr:VOC family protein [Acidocella aminolytica]GAN80917.1 glyoxalase/bleomycin resistance protein/dioxygenase [Acidocella aminolytica 101 = DSM 11237]GBQ35427.1 lactoylglutathione lyase [Acidocella aminolytica 101 = DSM 11237]SHF40711.1 glyoxylase I family protein [Acidocella aminolytica 101 = DSM 11237]